MNLSESKFRDTVIYALKKAGIRVVNLGSGTFDLFIDERKKRLMELKIASKSYKRFAKEFGVDLTPQTKALRILKKMPILFACDYNNIDRCYLAFPDELFSLIKARLKYPNVLIGINHFKNTGTFNNSIKMIVKYFKNA